MLDRLCDLPAAVVCSAPLAPRWVLLWCQRQALLALPPGPQDASHRRSASSGSALGSDGAEGAKPSLFNRVSSIKSMLTGQK